MADSILHIGMIGVGQIGRAHLETLQSLPGVQVVAVAGRDPARTEQAARRYGIETWTTDYHQLLEIAEVDAVTVCLHNNLHCAASVAALQAGKHVFCEKPMAGTYTDSAEMLFAARQNGKTLSIQLSTLFSAETKAAKTVVDEGWLGKPYYASSAGFRRRGRPYVDGYGTPAFVQKSQAAGGALYDMGVYHIANLLYLLGNPAPIRVTGRTYQEMPMDPGRQAASGYDVEEFATGLVFLEGNITLQIVEAWAAQMDYPSGSYLLGSQGGVSLKPFKVFRSLGDLDLNATADLDAFEYRLHNVRELGSTMDGPIQHWVASLRGQVPPLPTAEIALNTMLISEAIYLSHRENREVTADEVARGGAKIDFVQRG